MNKSINIKLRDFDSEYILEEIEDGNIVVMVPYIERDDEDEDVVKHNNIEFQKGDKADVIKQFFYEETTSIIRGGVVYNIYEIIFDESTLPHYIEPDVIE